MVSINRFERFGYGSSPYGTTNNWLLGVTVSTFRFGRNSQGSNP